MFEKFTGAARHVVVLAQEKAREYGHQHIGTEHLLLAVLRLPEPEGVAIQAAMAGLGVAAESVEAQVLEAVPRTSTQPPGHIPFTPRAKRVLELSLRESVRLDSSTIGPEHIVLGMLAEQDGVAGQCLLRDGRTAEQVRAVVLGAAPRTAGTPAERTPAVDEALAIARRLAAGGPIGSHHLLEALAGSGSSMAGRALSQLGVTGEAVAGQVYDLDVTETSDNTPDQAAAATMRWRVEADSAVLTSADPTLVANLRRFVELADGELAGTGPLAGPFVQLHRALVAAAGSIGTALEPPSDGPAEPLSLRDRLRRRRNG